ncbi:MAG TPA: hypothetical protein VMG08_10570 [Allosphingosinicella sp.]|nr:hypothetical protein [Allosphingosinicella sp.]
MRFKALLVVLLTLLVAPAVAQPQLDGWDAFADAIRRNPIGNPDALRGREFVLRARDAGNEQTLALTPTEAFAVEKTGRGVFRVTIVNPRVLVSDDPLDPYATVAWRLVTMTDGEVPFTAELEGIATCQYRVRFKRVGGADLDLQALQATYEATPTLSQPGAAEVTPDGPGYGVVRRAGSTGNVALTLTMRRRSDGRTLRSSPVTIPSCDSSAPQTVVINNDPTPGQCMQIEPRTHVQCTTCGPLIITVSGIYTNSCRRAVRCDVDARLYYGNELKADSTGAWVQLNGNTNWNSITDPIRLSVTRSEPTFLVNGPTLRNCRFVD